MKILILLLVVSCVTRREIDAAIWINNSPLPESVCEKEPIIKEYGFYRKLYNGKYEFISFCNPEARKYLGMHEKDFKKLIDEAYGNKRK